MSLADRFEEYRLSYGIDLSQGLEHWIREAFYTGAKAALEGTEDDPQDEIWLRYGREIEQFEAGAASSQEKEK